MADQKSASFDARPGALFPLFGRDMIRADCRGGHVIPLCLEFTDLVAQASERNVQRFRRFGSVSVEKEKRLDNVQSLNLSEG